MQDQEEEMTPLTLLPCGSSHRIQMAAPPRPTTAMGDHIPDTCTCPGASLLLGAAVKEGQGTFSLCAVAQLCQEGSALGSMLFSWCRLCSASRCSQPFPQITCTCSSLNRTSRGSMVKRVRRSEWFFFVNYNSNFYLR